MIRWKRVLSAVGPRRIVLAFGVTYVAIAVGRTLVRTSYGARLSSALSIFFLIGVFGVVLCYGGYKLPETDIREEFAPYIAGWCLGGFAVMVAILGLYEVLAEGGISNPDRAIPILTSFSTTAGFGVGIHDARARTRAHEVTQRNRELEEIQLELEETVDRLEEANEQLASSNERLEQFAYAASHDLQEPLRMVSSYLRLIEQRNDDLDADSEEFLEYAVDGADRMRSMIEGLLQYSRVETEGKPFEPVDLEAVFDDVLEEQSVLIDDCDGAVTVGSLPRVVGDEDQLRQVLGNLLRNALEYSGDEPPTVHVDAERNGSNWIVSVRDEGIGIDPDSQERIFDVFERLHAREEYEGTGLGLALCERIVERHGVRANSVRPGSTDERSESVGGDIWVDSEPGEGATFSFSLPARDAGE
ncbi:ATP-binding protein [Natronorubrum sp. FCH18a]|uniref:ATP-binding protein n=1 Tax=Natronorubrum sp. FCH18a TaxID=3447018 RepID=UPI003F512D5C